MFWGNGTSILGDTRRLQMVLFPLKCTCTPTLLHIFLKLSLSPLVRRCCGFGVAVVVTGLMSIAPNMGLVGTKLKVDLGLLPV